MPVRFIIVTLKPGVDPDEYEEWVRQNDRPFARTLTNLKGYNVYRISGPIEGAETAGWRYVERLDLESLEQHDRDLATPRGRAIIGEIESRFVDASKTIMFATDIIA